MQYKKNQKILKQVNYFSSSRYACKKSQQILRGNPGRAFGSISSIENVANSNKLWFNYKYKDVPGGGIFATYRGGRRAPKNKKRAFVYYPNDIRLRFRWFFIRRRNYNRHIHPGTFSLLGLFGRYAPKKYVIRIMGRKTKFRIKPNWVLDRFPIRLLNSKTRANIVRARSGPRLFPDNFSIPLLKYNGRVFNKAANFSFVGRLRRAPPLSKFQTRYGIQVLNLHSEGLFGYYFTTMLYQSRSRFAGANRFSWFGKQAARAKPQPNHINNSVSGRAWKRNRWFYNSKRIFRGHLDDFGANLIGHASRRSRGGPRFRVVDRMFFLRQGLPRNIGEGIAHFRQSKPSRYLSFFNEYYTITTDSGFFFEWIYARYGNRYYTQHRYRACRLSARRWISPRRYQLAVLHNFAGQYSRVVLFFIARLVVSNIRNRIFFEKDAQRATRQREWAKNRYVFIRWYSRLRELFGGIPLNNFVRAGSTFFRQRGRRLRYFMRELSSTSYAILFGLSRSTIVNGTSRLPSGGVFITNRTLSQLRRQFFYWGVTDNAEGAARLRIDSVASTLFQHNEERPVRARHESEGRQFSFFRHYRRFNRPDFFMPSRVFSGSFGDGNRFFTDRPDSENINRLTTARVFRGLGTYSADRYAWLDYRYRYIEDFNFGYSNGRDGGMSDRQSLLSEDMRYFNIKKPSFSSAQKESQNTKYYYHSGYRRDRAYRNRYTCTHFFEYHYDSGYSAATYRNATILDRTQKFYGFSLRGVKRVHGELVREYNEHFPMITDPMFTYFGGLVTTQKLSSMPQKLIHNLGILTEIKGWVDPGCIPVWSQYGINLGKPVGFFINHSVLSGVPVWSSGVSVYISIFCAWYVADYREQVGQYFYYLADPANQGLVLDISGTTSIPHWLVDLRSPISNNQTTVIKWMAALALREEVGHNTRYSYGIQRIRKLTHPVKYWIFYNSLFKLRERRVLNSAAAFVSTGMGELSSFLDILQSSVLWNAKSFVSQEAHISRSSLSLSERIVSEEDLWWLKQRIATIWWRLPHQRTVSRWRARLRKIRRRSRKYRAGSWFRRFEFYLTAIFQAAYYGSLDERNDRYMRFFNHAPMEANQRAWDEHGVAEGAYSETFWPSWFPKLSGVSVAGTGVPRGWVYRSRYYWASTNLRLLGGSRLTTWTFDMYNRGILFNILRRYWYKYCYRGRIVAYGRILYKISGLIYKRSLSWVRQRMLSHTYAKMTRVSGGIFNKSRKQRAVLPLDFWFLSSFPVFFIILGPIWLILKWFENFSIAWLFLDLLDVLMHPIRQTMTRPYDMAIRLRLIPTVVNNASFGKFRFRTYEHRLSTMLGANFRMVQHAWRLETPGEFALKFGVPPVLVYLILYYTVEGPTLYARWIRPIPTWLIQFCMIQFAYPIIKNWLFRRISIRRWLLLLQNVPYILWLVFCSGIKFITGFIWAHIIMLKKNAESRSNGIPKSYWYIKNFIWWCYFRYSRKISGSFFVFIYQYWCNRIHPLHYYILEFVGLGYSLRNWFIAHSTILVSIRRAGLYITGHIRQFFSTIGWLFEFAYTNIIIVFKTPYRLFNLVKQTLTVWVKQFMCSNFFYTLLLFSSFIEYAIIYWNYINYFLGLSF